MKLIVGLGNPDREYQNTRHNIGQTTILAFAKKLNLTFSSKPSLKSHLVQIGQGSEAAILAYPDTFMNLSGLSVQKLVRFYKISPSNLYLVHDDLDLGVGEWKLQFNRGPAGHHGVESVIQHLGTQEFWRYRIGIGRSPTVPVESYVLQPFSQDESLQILSVVDSVTQSLP